MNTFEYVVFRKLSRLKGWNVYYKSDGKCVGTIQYFKEWKQYVFRPSQVCVLSRAILSQIANFIDMEMK